MKLLLGGSPCTYWSIAQTKNRETQASGMGWELFKNYLIARDKYKPDYFLYENNKSMSAAILQEITRQFGFEPALINSALVSAQNRQRLYWVGKRNPDGTYSKVDVEQPEDRGILLRDILESGVAFREKCYTLKANYAKSGVVNSVDGGHFPAPMAAEPVAAAGRIVGRRINESGRRDDYNESIERIQRFEVNNDPGKTNCLSTVTKDNMVAEPLNATADGKAQCLRATCYKDGIRNMVGNTVDRRTCIAEPLRIGTIESNAQNADFDSQQYRVYSPDGKSVTLCGQGGGVGAKTGAVCYSVPIEYNPLQSCDVVVTDQNIRCTYKDGSGTAQGYTVYFDDVKGPSVIAGQASKMKIIEPATGKKCPVYEVRDGLITIKGKQYPIKLMNGYYIIRKLTVTECKRLQTVPDDYVFPVSDTQAYKMLGNGWTVDIIAHILSHIPEIKTDPVEVLSMYDGMSCGHIALDKLGANVTRYYATEIDRYAIKTTQENYPETIQLGDAFQVRDDGWWWGRKWQT